ncbi:hypothetical protein RKE29_18965 [Streptomyces sp. B1866]|uniref:hypothetical protein n=1 Tax=Streptomyces sp. B1866 TaxID=3075431 RepID=UPI00288C8603|nr:hypothetical protein [Streptomyces sp. B1866]MDT3398703.1 hypothetical protein [Streptomyces sp. B1866]
MRSLPLTLVARLLPVALLAVAGAAMTASADPGDAGPRAAASPSPSASHQAAAGGDGAAPDGARPPADPCAALPSGTVRGLVPGARTAGTALAVSDPTRRAGCSWHALHGYDYHWLDVTYDVTPTALTVTPAGTPVPGLGDAAAARDRLSTEDGQQTRETTVTVRAGGTLVTVTYSGSDFETRKAPAAAALREGALRAAKAALGALDG